MKRVHFIAIGGKAKHSLAITLKYNGYIVSGSDDKIEEPIYSSLKFHGVLPDAIPYNANKITSDIDAVIIGRRVDKDNVEFKKAQELGLKIFSYPEFIYEVSKQKQRIVIAGSHGKHTIASIVMHVLKYYDKDFDYLVSAPVQGHEGTILLSPKKNIIIIEGDEHISSTIDDRSKLEHYKPNITLLSGIAWDHVNAFPTYESYVNQFKKYLSSISEGGRLIYSADDDVVQKLISETPEGIIKTPFCHHPYEVFDNRTYLKISGGRLPIHLFGKHNMHNIAGALKLCQYLKISEEDFYKALKTFKGSSKHLQLIGKCKTVNVYLDFAHTPAKLNATIKAIREQYDKRELIVCLELHKSSILNDDFLNQYKSSMTLADEKIVYYNPEEIKGEGKITKKRIREAFGSSLLKVYTNVEDVKSELYLMDWTQKNLLLMSSSNFSGLNFKKIAKKIEAISY